MPMAIRVLEIGGPGVLSWQDVAVPAPAAGEIRLRHTFVGVNYIDVYHRSGVYKVGALPFTPGLEAAGVVTGVGPGVADLRPGDRVAYCSGPLGAYAQERVVPADKVVRIPEGIDDRTAAAMMLKGLTAQYLLRQTTQIVPGDTILFHAAAGGVGLLACQWARHLGATVIGTVSSDDKAQLARAHGCDHVIVYTRENFVERVREITGGRGVRVAYDGVGKDTFMGSLDCLSPLGLMVSFGQSSGLVPPFDITILSGKGSLYLTRPTIGSYASTPARMRAMAADLFAVVGEGKVRVKIGQVFSLSEAAAAHTALEARRTTGSTVLAV